MDYSKCLLIHDSEYTFDNTFVNEIKFRLNVSTKPSIDEFITEKIEEIKQKDFEIILIKESLSSNYLDFFGLLLSIHIRLSLTLDIKRFVPIIIISDIDLNLINRLSNYSNVLFTPGIHFYFNDDYLELGSLKKIVENVLTKNIILNDTNFRELFLDKIDISIPKENLSKHSISNEWSIYKWSKSLNITNNNELDEIQKHIKTSLYFKYLDNKYSLDILNLTALNYTFNINDTCRILYIDDESKKGWGHIFEESFSSATFNYIGNDFKDKTSEEIKLIAETEIKQFKPDILVLDLRLCDDDFKSNKLVEELTGTLILNEVKNINPGIQTIIFSATSKSIVLNHLFNIGILGYIKKESPDENYLSTKNNIKNFNDLINEGIENKYLIKIHEFTKKMKNHLSNSLNDFTVDDISFLKEHVLIIFEILNSRNSNKFNYAMITIYKCLEIIKDALTQVSNSNKSVFVIDNLSRRAPRSEKNRLDTNGNPQNTIYTSTQNRLHICIEEKLGFSVTDKEYIFIETIRNRRNEYIHPEANFVNATKIEILEWTELLKNIILRLN